MWRVEAGGLIFEVLRGGGAMGDFESWTEVGWVEVTCHGGVGHWIKPLNNKRYLKGFLGSASHRLRGIV